MEWWQNAIAGLFVGVMVGITGVGGGSLMAPILILIFRTAPATAVGTDLFFAAITKSVGGVVHHRQDGADLGIVGRLCLGSIPAAILTLVWIYGFSGHEFKGGMIVTVLGIVLILTAIATLFRRRLVAWYASLSVSVPPRVHRWQFGMTILAGAMLGVLVTLTSVGAGALGVTMLLALYPMRLTSRRIVGTDIVHAIPLTLVGGIGHLLIGNVDLHLLGTLLIGSIPGIVIGSRLTLTLPDGVVQKMLALVLLAAGVKMLV